MKKYLWLILMICIVSFHAILVSASEQGEAQKHHRNKYNMNLTLDAQNKLIHGTIELSVRNDSMDSWDKLCLRDYAQAVFQQYKQDHPGDSALPDSKISQAMLVPTGERLTIEPSPEDASVLFVDLPAPLSPGEETKIELNYTADIPGGGYRYAYHSFGKDKTSFELGNFYPILAVYENGEWIAHPYLEYGEPFYSKCSDYTVTLKVPEAYTVAASGTEKLMSREGGLSVWEIEAQNMRDLTITASNNLEKVSQDVDGIAVNCYYFAADGQTDHAQFAQACLHAGGESLRLFGRSFGAYPYNQLDIVESYLDYGGMEYPGLVRIGSFVAGFLDHGVENRSQAKGVLHPSVENAVAHEVGHQWFYAVVGSDSYKESWLDESFAAYAALLYKQSYMQEKQFLKEVSPETTDSPLTMPLDSYQDNYVQIIYTDGSLFLYKLQSCMGDDAFFSMMREYYDTFRFKEATTEDFRRLVSKHSPSNEKASALLQGFLSAPLPS